MFAAMNVLSGWQNFYVIVGSSAGALIGLQFVVLTLIAQLPSKSNQEQVGHAFATPTVVHFGAVLLIASILSAPWRGVVGAAILCGALGLIGAIYEIVVVRRMRSQKLYHPEFEDWLFHALLPFAAYAALAASGYEIRFHAHEAMFGVATSVLLLLFIGIHNAWDGVTYHVFVKKPKVEIQQQRDEMAAKSE